MKMKKKNKVLKDTTTFVIPRGKMVVVSSDCLEFEPFYAALPQDYKVRIGIDWFEIDKCSCCSNLLLTYRDELGRYNTATLRYVKQISGNQKNPKEAA